MKISVIIPVYNEAESLPVLLQSFEQLKLSEQYEIIVVDDSPGGVTADACAAYCDSLPLSFIKRGARLGLASAVVEGFDAACGDWLVCMDGDGSHPAQLIERLAEQFNAQSNFAFILGSRYVDQGYIDARWGFMRRLLSRLSCLSTVFLTGVKDPMSGFFALTKAVYERSRGDLRPRGYKIALEIMVKSGEPVLEIPFTFGLRQAGKSKLTAGVALAYMRQLLHLYFYKLTHKKSRH